MTSLNWGGHSGHKAIQTMASPMCLTICLHVLPPTSLPLCVYTNLCCSLCSSVSMFFSVYFSPSFLCFALDVIYGQYIKSSPKIHMLKPWSLLVPTAVFKDEA